MNRRSNSSSSMVRKLRKRPHSATTTATTATTTPTTPTTPTTEGEDYEEQQVSSPEAPITAPQMSGSMVVFPVGPQLRKHLTCRLCSGYFREPVTITECLHTFCKSCLYFAFSQGYSQCPTCKVDLGTYPFRSTLADRTLQELVDKVLFPELKEADDEKERQFYKKRGIPLKDEFRDKEEAANDDNDDDYDDDDDDDGYGKSDKQGRDGGSSRLGAALPVAATPNSAEGNNLGGDEGPAKDDEAYTDKGKASSGKASASSSVRGWRILQGISFDEALRGNRNINFSLCMFGSIEPNVRGANVSFPIVSPLCSLSLARALYMMPHSMTG